MRIAYICADPDIPVFGNRSASCHIREVIRAFLRRGADVELFATRCEGEVPLDLKELIIHQLPCIPAGKADNLEQAAMAANRGLHDELLRNGRFDLLYERYSLWSFAGIAYAKQAGIPGLLEVNAPLIDEQARHRVLINRNATEKVAQYLFNSATALIAVSDTVAQSFQKYQVDKSRIHVVPNGVDPNRFRPDMPPILPPKSGTFTVGYVGSMEPWQGLDTLVEAFHKLHMVNPQVRLLLVGDGTMRQAVDRELRQRGLADVSILTGPVDPDDVPRWLTSMHVAVAPYPVPDDLYYSPLKVYEYMAAALPVVASRVGQLENLVQHGNTGILVPPNDAAALADALSEIQRDPQQAARLGSAGRQTVLRSHTWDAVAIRNLEIAGVDLGDLYQGETKRRKIKKPSTLRQSLPRLLQIVKRFWPRIRPYVPQITGAFVLLLAPIFLQLLKPWPLKIIIDYIIAPQPEGDLFGLTVGEDIDRLLLLTIVVIVYLLIIVLTAGASYISTISLAKVGNSMLRGLRNDLYQHILNLSLSFHSRSRTGDLITRVTGDVRQLHQVTVEALLPLTVDFLTLLAMLALMMWLDWRLAALALTVLPILALSSLRTSRKIKEVSRLQRKRHSAMATATAESLGAIKIVQALSLEDTLQASFFRNSDKDSKAGVRGKRLSQRMIFIVTFLSAVGTVIVMWFGGRLVLLGALSAGDLLVFLSYMGAAFKPVRRLAKYSGRISRATASGERVLAVLETEPQVRDLPGAISTPPFQGSIRFQEVSFNYEPGHLVLRDISLDIKAGQHVAIVGPSGSGKSTLTGLLLRLYDPADGVIMIDGQDIRNYKLKSLRPQISILLQESVLFATSVFENIAYGSPEASAGEIVAASRMANAHGFIQALPDGYDTTLGERGATLSGGQRQRIAIARTAIGKSPILVLDEPTTGLDRANQKLVHEALDRLTSGKTTIWIAHDLQIAEQSDYVYFLLHGRIVESGTHEQLMELDGHYASMYRLQLTTQNGSRQATNGIFSRKVHLQPDAVQKS